MIKLPENKKLITRWDSERELFHDDIVHVYYNTKYRTCCTTKRNFTKILSW